MNTPEDPNSPYQAPAQALSAGAEELSTLAPHERAGAPKVFGVLSIIFASIELLLSGVGMLMGAALGAAERLGNGSTERPELSAMMRPLAKVYQGVGIQSLILFVMSALLLAIGIGQVRYRAWACRWSVYWGAAGLVCVGLIVAISLLIISPAYAELFEAAHRAGTQEIPNMSAFGTMMGGTFAAVSVVLHAPYPTIMLLFFTRARVRASMRG
jgi:hypothetical protein